MKVAIVHDWLVGGGAEKVVLELHQLYPEAPIYTSYCTPAWRDRLDGKVVTGFLQRWPFSRMRKLIPVLRIWWFSRLNLADYDVVISSSGAEAKGIKVPQGTVHINYCYAPTHYYWSRYDEYLEHPGWGIFNPVGRLGLRLLVGPLRKWDYKAAQRPHYMIAISTHIKDEIKKYYDRDVPVIFPPVDIARFKQKPGSQRQGFITAGRQTPYKRFDLAVEACTLANQPLTVLGKGPDNERLRKLAGSTVTFVNEVPDEAMERYFKNAAAFIFPGTDDFGITPVEALAAGTPVIAYKAGGALDYVIPGKTGILFADPTPESLSEVLQAFRASDFDERVISRFAETFATGRFRDELQTYVNKCWEERV